MSASPATPQTRWRVRVQRIQLGAKVPNAALFHRYTVAQSHIFHSQQQALEYYQGLGRLPGWERRLEVKHFWQPRFQLVRNEVG